MLLARGDVRVEVDPHGARLRSWRVAGHELLGGVDLPGVDPTVLSGCFPMAPYAGRIGRARFRFAGQEHVLPATLPPHAAHGVVRDVVWDVVRAEAGQGVLAAALGGSWPFGGWARQRVELEEDALLVELAVGNDEREMPASSGLHPWFARRLAGGGELEVTLPATAMHERGDDGLPTGARVPVPPGPYDDCFDLAGPPVLTWPGALRLTVESDARVWVLCDVQPGAVALEPQTAPPDALNSDEAAVVGPGRPLVLTTRFRWERLGR